MRKPEDSITILIDQLYQKHFGQLVVSLLNFSSSIDLETAEDIVQDSFTTALSVWNEGNIPENPVAWIYTVGKNKAVNRIREQKRFSHVVKKEVVSSVEPEFSNSLPDDQNLKLLFACAHPDLSPKVQVVITLKYVVNLKVEAISKILGMTIDGIDKLLVRARQKIKDENILLRLPDAAMLASRLPMVHNIIYLLFSEGYKSSWGKELLREELCEEALVLSKLLIDSPIGNKETAALQALMLFNAARFKARFGPSGELIDLEEQNRQLWNTQLIQMGCKFLMMSRGGSISSYHLEASVAFLHCSAKDFRSTDWHSICNLYTTLLQMNANPFVELNYTIALYYSGQKQLAFQKLTILQQHPFLNQYYLLSATLGKFHFLEGNYRVAKEFFYKTISQTNSQVEKDYIHTMICKVDEAEKLSMVRSLS